MGRRTTSVAAAVAVFAISGLVVLVVVGVAGVWTLRRVSDGQALTAAEELSRVTARGVVQPRLTEGIVKRRTESLVAIDNIVQGAVLRDPVVAVRIWDPQGGAVGKMVYASDPEFVTGNAVAMSHVAFEANETGEVAAGPADGSRAENRPLAGHGRLYEVVVPIQTPEGHPLLFETTLRLAAVRRSAAELWRAFVPVLALALLVFAAILIPLAYRLARRVRESQRDRERLLQRAIDSSDLERRRITSDLHDGLVQEFAGLAMSLSAAADTLDERDPAGADMLRDGADRTRQGVRSLRSALMGIYPPSVQRAGLAAALSDLVTPLEATGVSVTVEVPVALSLPPELESLLFRCAQEAVRNIGEHARATMVRIEVAATGKRCSLRIVDNGEGFSPEQRARAGAEGHLGLRLLEDLVHDARGELTVTSGPGKGTTVLLEVPR